MELVNLTPHLINMLLVGGVEIKLGSQGEARISNWRERTGFYLNGIPTFIRKETRIQGLPKPKQDKLYIVSRSVAEVAWSRGRTDVLALSGHIYNRDLTVRGCKSFDINPYNPDTLKILKGATDARLERVR